MKYLLLLAFSTYLMAQTIHSSASTYYESKTFSDSVQKEDGVAYGVGADIHYKGSAYKVTYEYANTNTKQPPLKEDLTTQKIFAKYTYKFSNHIEVNLNYINILNDNIAPTDKGVAYGLGLTYAFNKRFALNFTQYYTDYKDFNVYQSDFKIDYKNQIGAVKFKITSITKYISLENRENSLKFAENAQKDYLTSGLKIHSHYNHYHLGLGAYYGKRAFAIMNDGFKIQHHAMEFDRTYALGIGKSISDFVLRFQYIYQRAEELPTKNENVEVQTLRFIANYKF